MMRWIWVLTLFIAPVTMSGFYANRKPNAEEQRAIDKYARTMNKVLDQFRSDDWVETVDFSIADPTLNPATDPPMDIDEIMQRTYHVRPGSARDKKVIAPQQQKIAQLKDPSEKQIAMARTEDLKLLQVQVRCNQATPAMTSAPDPKTDPDVPGATFVHKDRNNPFSHGAAYVLFFSNGSTGKWDQTNGLYRFKFAHPANTPYIENVEIRIYGAEDRIQELLKKIDWKQVNAALTL